MTNNSVLMPGDIIYFYDRDAYNPNDAIFKMSIIEKNDRHYAHTQDGHYSIEFEVTNKHLSELNHPNKPAFFAAFDEAKARSQQEADCSVARIKNLTRDALVKELYLAWLNESNLDQHAYQAMRSKIHAELGVDLIEDGA